MGTDADEHRYFEGMAVVHVLGGLDESDGRVFRSHLLECSDCRARVGELRALAHDLADVERDERRVRAAKAIETKRRERTDEDDGEEERPLAPPGLRLYPRLLVLIGVLLLSGLAVWNFGLRSTIANQQEKVDNLSEAAAVVAFGTEISPSEVMEGVRASIKTRDDQLVLIVTGLDDDSLHEIYQLDVERGVVDSHGGVPSVDGRIHLMMNLHEDARHLVLIDPGDGVTDPANDPNVLEARLPLRRE